MAGCRCRKRHAGVMKCWRRTGRQRVVEGWRAGREGLDVALALVGFGWSRIALV